MNSIGNVTQEFLSSIKCPDSMGVKLRYLIVNPYKEENKYAFPAGLGAVASALKVSGREVYTLNLDIYDEPMEKLKEELLGKKIDVLMAGGFSVEFTPISTIIHAAKNIVPNLIVAVGGGLISADPETAMEALEIADYGMIGEGEITVNALAYALEHGEDATFLPGIIGMRDGKWVANVDFPEIRNLDSIPYPDYEGFEFGTIIRGDNYSNKWTKRMGSNRIVYMNISRSCPFLCTFCFHTCGNHYRSMSMDAIFKYIDWILKLYPEVEALSFDGELTFSNERFAEEFCRRIAPYKLKWRANTRADVITEKMLRCMKESGCVAIMFGIESACNSILKSMKKRITIEQVERAFEYANRVDIYARGTLIFGDPEETTETLNKTIKWYLANRKWNDTDNFWNITLGLIKAYPGTALYKDACAKSLIKDKVQFLKDGCPPFNLSKLSDEEYAELPELIQRLYRYGRNVTEQNDC